LHDSPRVPLQSFSFPRFIGDVRNAALNASWSSERKPLASVPAFVSSRNGRARHGESSASACLNFRCYEHSS
jgi:hypothetical protein